MRWSKILSRDKNQCLYCGDDEPPLFTIVIDGSTESTAGNTATICEICKITDARKVLGKPAERVFLAEIKRRNEHHGIDGNDTVYDPTFDELVDAGQHRPILPQRDYMPYGVGDGVVSDE
jgi:hypothetical protein